MTYFNSMEAVENGDSYVFIKRDMDKMVWYVTCFWTWYNLPDKGVIFIKAYPRTQRRKRTVTKVINGKKMKVIPPPQKTLTAWTDQEYFETKDEFWEYIDALSRNSEVTIQSRIYLEARKILKPGQ